MEWSSRTPGQPVGYAVVGLGRIAQTAVLPAFNARHNTRLVALVLPRAGSTW